MTHLPRTAPLLLAFACSKPDAASDSAAHVFDPGPSPYALDGVLRPTDLQALGTHNSTHIEPESPVHPSHEYTHASLTTQLADQGVRALELDLHLHRDDGFHVFHLPVIDAETTCMRFEDCLAEVRAWSLANPWHLPLMIWIEPKDEDLDAATADYVMFGDRHDELEAEIRGALPADCLFTPDDLRGDHDTLPDAIAADGWPTLGELRGKVIFSMLDSGDHRATYLSGSDTLEGRVMFVDSDDATEPFAATMKINDAAGEAARVEALARAGFLITSNVRDGPEHDEATGAAHLDGSLTAGAHFLMSDRPAPIDGWQTTIPDGQPARCNPVTAPDDCTAAEVEALP